MSAMRQKWFNRRIWEYLSEKLEKAFLLRARALNCYLISPPSKSWLKDFSLNDHFLLDVSTKPLIYPARVTISSKLFFYAIFSVCISANFCSVFLQSPVLKKSFCWRNKVLGRNWTKDWVFFFVLQKALSFFFPLLI